MINESHLCQVAMMFLVPCYALQVLQRHTLHQGRLQGNKEMAALALRVRLFGAWLVFGTMASRIPAEPGTCSFL